MVPQLQSTSLRPRDAACRGWYFEGVGRALVSQGNGVKEFNLATLQETDHLVAGFGRVRGTRDVGQDAAGAREGAARSNSSAWSTVSSSTSPGVRIPSGFRRRRIDPCPSRGVNDDSVEGC